MGIVIERIQGSGDKGSNVSARDVLWLSHTSLVVGSRTFSSLPLVTEGLGRCCNDPSS
jgi:hypothetical protein